MLYVVDSEGSRVTTHERVAQVAVNYFRNSLGS